MNGNFQLFGTSQQFRVQANEARANGGPSYPKLWIPVLFEFSPIQLGRSAGMMELISVESSLSVGEEHHRCSESNMQLFYKITHKGTQQIQIGFALTDKAIHTIEKSRKGNVLFHLEFTLQVAALEEWSVPSAIDKITKQFVTDYGRGTAFATFQIEQSHWVNQVLPQLGVPSYTLVELPATHQLIPDEYAQSRNEFEQAQRYFAEGDYDKTVAHCRAAIDPFKNKLAELKQYVQSRSQHGWATDITTATEAWLEKTIKTTFGMTSKTHHAPSTGHFDRTEAQIVLMVTTAVIAYIGKIGFQLT